MRGLPARIGVALFFTRGVSLKTWDRAGLLEREVALYRRLSAYGVETTLVTYGDASDLAYAHRLQGMAILCNRRGLAPDLYERLLPCIHGLRLRRCSIIKTNQTEGAEAALRAARLWRKKFIARCGYMWSEFLSAGRGPDSPEARRARETERRVFSAADAVAVTASEMAADIIRRVPAAEGRVCVIPNYVDAELFHPAAGREIRYELIFIGRLADQKNVGALLEALETLGARAAIIGDGPLGPRLRQRYGDMNGRVSWIGTVPNERLPDYLNRSAIFILPSHYEGHPKTLLEAMSCGLPVIGADSPGIRDVIKHGENGWLCGTDPESIRKALEKLLCDAALRARLGRSGREWVAGHCSLNGVAAQELEMYRAVLALQG